MQLLIISDIHQRLSKDEIAYLSYVSPDVIIMCGDIYPSALEFITNSFSYKTPIFYVAGNHDNEELYKRYPNLINCHRSVHEYMGVTFGGYEGSLKYKEGSYQKTQRQSKKELKKMDYCDIFITHDIPYDKELPFPHCGLKGIKKYIKKNEPRLHVCGHIHREEQRGKTQVIYKYKLIEYV